MLVVDASTTLAWFLPGQMTATAVAAWDFIRGAAIVVPGIWQVETQNAILRLLRQRRITLDEATEARRELSVLSKRIVGLYGEQEIDLLWESATRHMLTPYDACYVHLARQLNLPLASDDKAIRAAAVAMGVALI